MGIKIIVLQGAAIMAPVAQPLRNILPVVRRNIRRISADSKTGEEGNP